MVMIAEESTAFDGVTRPLSEGGLGFGFKWNMGWMNDTLRYLALDPIHRQYDHHDMTFAMLYQYTEHYILPISHDEVVHGKGSMINKVPQDPWRQFATLRAYYSFMWAFPGKKLLFMGCDFGQRREWNEEASLEWWVTDLPGHHGLQRLVRDLNTLYRAHPALWKLDSEPAGFRWINNHDAGANTFSWLRFDGADQQIACVDQLLPAALDPAPHRAARGRHLDRDLQLRRRGLRRDRHVQQLRPGHGHRRPLRRPPGQRHDRRPTHGSGVPHARTGDLTQSLRHSRG